MLPPDVVALLDLFAEVQILSSAQMTELAGDLSNLGSAAAMLLDLEKRGWLTAYQAEQLRKNRVKQIVFGAYILLEPLGRGGMGQVFRARHRVMKRVVALKIIRRGHLPHGEAVQRFTQEIEAAAKLSHPNIVTSHDAGRAGDFHFFVMELIDGAGLDTLLREQGRLPIGLACELARQTALGLQHAHDQGLVHRDIKPQNLILDRRGTVKILDMGLARVRYDPAGGGPKALTKMGVIMGTADYIAPEQILDCSRVDGRADIYSLGCTLFHLLTGHPPHLGIGLREKLELHLRGEPRPVEELRPDVPPSLSALIRRMLARKISDRLASAAEVAAALTPFCTPAGATGTVAISEPTAETLLEGSPLAKVVPAATPPAPPPAPAPGAPLAAGPPFAPPALAPIPPPAQSQAGGRRINWRLAGAGGSVLTVVVVLALVFWPKSSTSTPEPSKKPFTLAHLRHEDLPPRFRDELPDDVVAVLGDDRVMHRGIIHAFAVSGDGKVLATCEGHTLKISDAATLKEMLSITIEKPVHALAVSANGDRVAGGSPFGVWDTKTGRELWSKPVGKEAVYSVTFTRDGEHLFTAGSPGALRLWNARTGEIEKEIPDEYGNRVGATLMPDEALGPAKTGSSPQLRARQAKFIRPALPRLLSRRWRPGGNRGRCWQRHPGLGCCHGQGTVPRAGGPLLRVFHAERAVDPGATVG